MERLKSMDVNDPVICAKTQMDAMPESCNECKFGRRYGCVGDVYCQVLDEYFTGNVKPPYKDRPDECPLIFAKSATAIETLLAERDAAVKDLVTAESCKTCGNMSSWCADNPDMCMGYKWRGVPPREATH